MFACSWPSQQDNHKASWHKPLSESWFLVFVTTLSLNNTTCTPTLSSGPSTAIPQKSIQTNDSWLMYLLLQLHPGWAMASPAGQTDPAGRAPSNWAIRTQPRVLLYLTCNVSPSTTCTLLPLTKHCSKHHTARVLLSSREGQNQAGQTHSLYSISFISLENRFLWASIGKREQMYHI